MKSPAPMELTRSVRDGSVFCPVKMARVDVESCVKCRFLTRVDHGASRDELTELACSPTWAALLGGMSI